MIRFFSLLLLLSGMLFSQATSSWFARIGYAGNGSGATWNPGPNSEAKAKITPGWEVGAGKILNHHLSVLAFVTSQNITFKEYARISTSLSGFTINTSARLETMVFSIIRPSLGLGMGLNTLKLHEKHQIQPVGTLTQSSDAKLNVTPIIDSEMSAQLSEHFLATFNTRYAMIGDRQFRLNYASKDTPFGSTAILAHETKVKLTHLRYSLLLEIKI